MKTYVYRSALKPETYLYLAKKDAFDDLPEELVSMFGEPELFLEPELSPDQPLGRENVTQVIKALLEKGYYLQLPPAPDFQREWDRV